MPVFLTKNFFLFFHFSYVWESCACVCMYLMLVCWCTCIGGSRLMSGTIVHCSSTLFIEAESLLPTQNSLMKLVLQSVCIRQPLYSAFRGWNHMQAGNPTQQLYKFLGSKFWFSHFWDKWLNHRTTAPDSLKNFYSVRCLKKHSKSND